jgi:hypothetical protein
MSEMGESNVIQFDDEPDDLGSPHEDQSFKMAGGESFSEFTVINQLRNMRQIA